MMEKKCSRDGCTVNAFARGMCRNHYTCWYEKQRRNGREPQRPESVRAVIESAMPGTRKQIMRRLGVTMAPIHRTMKKMHDAGEIHIGGWEPPIGNGGQWTAIYAFGPGVDAQLCAVWRDVHHVMRKRASQSASGKRARNKERMARGPAFAALLAPLQMGA